MNVSSTPANRPVPKSSRAPASSGGDRTYEVKKGDTLSGIAQKFDTDWKTLARANKLDDPDLILPGQKLRIPGKEAPAAEKPRAKEPRQPGRAPESRYTEAQNNQFDDEAGSRSPASGRGRTTKRSKDEVLGARKPRTQRGNGTGGTPAPAPGGTLTPAPGDTPTDPPVGTVPGQTPGPQVPPTAEEKFLAQDAAKKIRAAERNLKRAGFDPGKVDAKLTDKSRQALSGFQQAAGLPATGQLDQKTSRTLERVAGRVKEHRGELLGPGQKSDKVLQSEKQLKRLGYDPGRVDGVFDARTGQAVRQFRKDQPELKDGSPLLGKDSRRVLTNEARRFNHDPFRRRVKDTAEGRREDRRVDRAVEKVHGDGTRGLREGSTNQRAVETVQEHLRAAGYSPKRTDGVFDERTAGAVKQFQRKAGLEPTGTVDPSTWKRLQKARMEADGPTSPKQREGEISGAVKQTEGLLKKLGMNPGKVDGHYTQQTQNAVDRFRRKHKMGNIGEGVGAGTLKRLKRAVSAGGSAQARRQMNALLDVAARNATGKQPQGWCLKAVQDYLDQVTYGKGKVPRLSYARNYAEYLNSNGNARRLGLRRLNIDNPYKAPPGAIVVVRAGTPGTAHPTAGDIVVKGHGSKLYNDGEMSYGGPGNFPPGNNYVLGVYVPRGYRPR